MSLTISNITIQLLSVNSETGAIAIQSGEQPIEVTEKLSLFVEALHNIYNSKGSKAYAHFKDEVDAEGNVFEHKLVDYLQNDTSFEEFSKQSGILLTEEIAKYDIAESGYLVICHYEMLGGRYLLASILPVTEHFYVDGQLNISADKHIDTSKLQLAARIDLFEYKDNRQGDRYISFIKGRAGRKVADFFLDFLGCEEGINAKEQSQVLVDAIEDFVNVQQLDAAEKQAARKEVVSYCKEQQSLGKDVTLQEIAATIPQEENGHDFYQFCKQQDYPIADSFPPEASVINKSTKFSGYGGGISVSFERSHFGTDVIYNPTSQTLTLHKVPPNLKDQLLKLLAENEQDT